MKTMILLLYLLGSTQSLPTQLNPVLGLPPTKPAPHQATLLNQQQPNQVLPSLSLIPLMQMFTLGSDLQLLNPAAGMPPGTQTLPLSLGGLNTQQQLQSQMLPVIVAHLGAHGAIISSEELPVAPKIFAGLLFQPLFPGSILPTSPANPDAQNGILPAGQAGVNPAIQGTPEGFSTTPSDIDDDFGVTAPAGIQKGMHTTQETTTGSPNVQCKDQPGCTRTGDDTGEVTGTSLDRKLRMKGKDLRPDALPPLHLRQICLQQPEWPDISLFIG
ncbi:amelotin [Neovison vison]|uniref:amelotin n=1 Tax=Neovison vison TaxID=452646 RepID=UPI001CF01E56|nr:amelotin [Neogale vison]